ncbi:MAG: penicillin acylase family protein [Deltaproteobacteria bacterium]|nr:penicillin acylase family protein [Deltaproteobacteria bacterium]MBI3296412.1 penicillin acylase family protein [Deltaproteobacteria bacterium]
MKKFLLLFISVVYFAGCSQKAMVRVKRNEFNLPTIEVVAAKDAREADYHVFFQQGYEQATDRMIQMDVLRRLPTGRLAELLGPPAMEKDALNYGVGFPYAVDRSFEAIQKYPEVVAALNAYADGVNSFIDQIAVRKPDVLRIYRDLARNADYRPEHWVARDSVAMAKAMTFFLSSSLEEKLHFGLFGVLNFGIDFATLPVRMGEYFDTRPIEKTFIVGDRGGQSDVARRTPAAASKVSSDAFAVLKHMPKGCLNLGFPWPDCAKPGPMGSNNWVVSARYAGTGANLLANDPHLPLTFPTMFYENALNSKLAGGTVSVAGLHVPGGPGIMIGHNGAMGWGFTNLAADVDDVYFEELSADGKSAKFGNTWVPLEVETIEIGVRLGTGVVERRPINIRWVVHTYAGDQAYRSHRRPIFSDHHPQLKDALYQIEQFSDMKYAMSYRWVGFEPTVEVAAVFNMNRAQTMEEMRSAIQLFSVGTQNIVYADRKGNIGYMAHGLFPKRRYLSKDYPPFVPVVGHTEWDWDGYQEEVPESINPEKGYVVSANNDPWGYSGDDRNYEHYLGYGFSTGIRAARIEGLIQQRRGKLDVEAMKTIQFDHHDLLAVRFIEQLSKLDLKLGEKEGAYLSLLKSWNGDSNRRRHEPLIWNRLIQALLRRHFGEKFRAGSEKLFNLDQFIQSSEALKTMYHKINDGLEGRATGLALNKIKALWTTAFSDVSKCADEENLEGKTWGEVSHMAFTSPLADIFPSFAAFPIERDGTFDTVDVAWGAYGPNFRLILRLSEDGIKGENVLPGGNYSPTDTTRLYRELLMWRDGKYRPLVSY